MCPDPGPGEAFRILRNIRALVVAVCGLGLPGVALGQEAGPSPLGLPDIADYLSALDPGPREPAEKVRFREIWARPEGWQGRQVLVEGRVARRFRQDALGKLPALVELTLVDREGNPWIVVLPAQATQTEPGKRVAASGTFLRMIRYKAGDGERVAPLIVGPKGPTIQVPSQPSRPPSQDQVRIFTRTDWTVGLVACGLVAVVLARQMLRKPARRLRRPNDWPIADPGDREGQTP